MILPAMAFDRLCGAAAARVACGACRKPGRACLGLGSGLGSGLGLELGSGLGLELGLEAGPRLANTRLGGDAVRACRT